MILIRQKVFVIYAVLCGSLVERPARAFVPKSWMLYVFKYIWETPLLISLSGTRNTRMLIPYHETMTIGVLSGAYLFIEYRVPYIIYGTITLYGVKGMEDKVYKQKSPVYLRIKKLPCISSSRVRSPHNTKIFVCINMSVCIGLGVLYVFKYIWETPPKTHFYRLIRSLLTTIAPKQSICLYLFFQSANLSGLGAGLCLGWSSPVLVKLEDSNSTVLLRPPTDEEATWLASLAPLVCVVVLLIGPPIVDRIGRKQAFSLVYLPKLVAGLLFLFGNEVWELLLARVAEGISLAFYYVVLSTYTAEIADKNIRGSLGTIMQIFRSGGIMIMLCFAPFLSYTDLHITFVVLTIISALPVVFLPETPYFLYSKGKIEESEKVLNAIRTTKQEVQKELQMFGNNQAKEELYFAMGISLFLSAIGPCTGFSVVVFYLQNVMESAGTSVKSEVASLIVGVVQLVACFPPILITDRFGRKPILFVNVFLIAVGSVILSIADWHGSFFWCKEAGYEIIGFLNILPTISASVINLGLTGYLSMLFVLVPELFLGAQRALGVSVSCIALSLGIFAVTKSYAALVSSLGFPGTFWMFSGISLVLSVFCIVLCTRDKREDV
ncbi:hypothetical protein ABMA28_017173 [Loxostege sticticalis]|uniref:Major facilitator superfamily (MFS) profile domain-containing protein n=1 Tax=Loxostege sticticalis TaxID=481309 RepID=A0ABD0S2N4_LOXSC